MTDKPLDLEAIEAIYQAATGGIWVLIAGLTRDAHIVEAAGRTIVCQLLGCHQKENGELMAQSRTLIPALVAELRASRARVAELEEEDRRWDKHSLVQIVDERDELRARVAELEGAT